MACPETATLLLRAGVLSSCEGTREEMLTFQEGIFQAQVALETAIVRQAEVRASRGNNVVVLMDRGLLDGAAYMARVDWLEMIARNGFTEVTKHYTL